MSKLRLIPYAVLTSSVLFSGGAFAQSMYDINQRQDYQQDRIDRVVRDGQITRSEQYRLEQGERQIDRAQSRAMADGHVKFFNEQKGFGFVVPESGGTDVYVHASALRRSGLSILLPEQKVRFSTRQGQKGVEVDRIELA